MMADGLCGPTNALKNFSSHASADRTLQQDRQAQRPFASRGLPSQLTNDAGALDHEFQAFQSSDVMTAFQRGNFITATQPLVQHTLPPLPPRIHIPSSPSTANQWVNDFRRMRVSDDGPRVPGDLSAALRNIEAAYNVGTSSFQGQLARKGHKAGQSYGQGYEAGQAKPLAQRTPGYMGDRDMGRSVAYVGQQGQQGMGIGQGQQLYQPHDYSKQHDSPKVNDAVFNKAFDNVAKAQAKSRHQPLDWQTAAHNGSIAESSPQDDDLQFALANLANQKRIGSDTIMPHYTNPNTTNDVEDPHVTDLMAEQARVSLEKMRPIMESNENFRDSQFYNMMRQFRDREIYLIGTKVVAREGFVVEHMFPPQRQFTFGSDPSTPKALSATAPEFKPGVAFYGPGDNGDAEEHSGASAATSQTSR